MWTYDCFDLNHLPEEKFFLPDIVGEAKIGLPKIYSLANIDASVKGHTDGPSPDT